MSFTGKSTKVLQEHASPEELFLGGSLPRTSEGVDGLWLHQGDVIRAYADHHIATPNLALELPTGSGKTLPGLLIAEWVRRRGEGPILFATPTKQLARQVLATATREGIPGHLLVGRARDWDVAHQSAVEGGEAVGITTYSSVFNSSPKLPVPRLILLDDAHAGEQYVASEYSVSIRRSEDPAGYESVLEAVAPMLSGLLLQRLRGEPDPGAHHQVRLLLPAMTPRVLSRLDETLAALPDYKFSLAMIRSGLSSCCLYLSYAGVQIRPMIPPTFDNPVFSRAKQRLYLSATLGMGGELERAFGVPEIERMPLPSKTPPRSGRRLFVFPDLVDGADAVGLTKDIIALTNKALVLSQDTIARTESAARTLAPDGVTVLGRDEVEGGLQSFAAAPTGVLGLANRYDGLDLPGAACRIVVLGGKPDAVGLQEKFLSERAEASAALSERIRTRIVQGAGRCTRGPNDYAVVVVLGSDLTRYFSRPDERAALEPELQAEIEFGWANSRGKTREQILENVTVFLEHGTTWREHGEPLVAEFRQDAVKDEAPSAAALGASVHAEVTAWHMAFRAEWIEASRSLQDAARLVGAGGESTRGYRALLLFIAGVWLRLGATDGPEMAAARDLVRQAVAASGTRGTWLKEMPDLPGATAPDIAAVDLVAINAIAARLVSPNRPNRLSADLLEMRQALAQDDAEKYEPALTTLGKFLGAEAHKPAGSGRCDSAWQWDTACWLTLEAKSEQHPDGLIPLHDIRQTNTQLDQLAADIGADRVPASSASILITDRLAVDAQHAPVANPEVFLASRDVIQHLASDISAVWEDLLSSARGTENTPEVRKHVQQLLTDHGCLPTQVVERLTQTRIRPES